MDALGHGVIDPLVRRRNRVIDHGGREAGRHRAVQQCVVAEQERSAAHAVQIVDLYHARQHLWELARKLHPNDEVNQKVWMKVHQRRLLDQGKIEKLVCAIRSIVSANPEVAEKIRTEADYFERNAGRMHYPNFRRQHLFVGSGVIEDGCKTVIGSRLKESGMF